MDIVYTRSKVKQHIYCRPLASFFRGRTFAQAPMSVKSEKRCTKFQFYFHFHKFQDVVIESYSKKCVFQNCLFISVSHVLYKHIKQFKN